MSPLSLYTGLCKDGRMDRCRRRLWKDKVKQEVAMVWWRYGVMEICFELDASMIDD